VTSIGWENAPHRVLRNAIVREWEAAGKPPSGQRPGEGEVVGRVTRAGESWEVHKDGVVMPTPHFTGDLEAISWWAGQSYSLVRDIKPAGQIVQDIVAEAEEVINRLARDVVLA
jgi:NAD(P)H-dependent flavin oxidoreductase YrpB (nitropropane dioxygenase family)